MFDLHNNVRAIRVIAPIAVGTTGTGQTGKVIDLQGYESCEFAISYGAITATAATFTVVVREGDATGSLTSVADADLIGTESAAGIAAGTPRTSNVNNRITKRIGYKGAKRYVNCSVRSTTTAGTPISVVALLGHARRVPLAT